MLLGRRCFIDKDRGGACDLPSEPLGVTVAPLMVIGTSEGPVLGRDEKAWVGAVLGRDEE